MRVLITGGAGFIGSHLANQLHERGHFVRVLDDLSSGDPAALDGGINLTRGDVRDIPKLWSLLQGVDVVYHDVNVGGTVALLEACRDVGAPRVILASSATVYGNQQQQPIDEALPTHPAVPYAVSKVAAEQYLFNIGALSGFETVALRIFNAYGPGQPLPPVHAPVIPQFMHQIIGGGSVVVFGDGSQSRDFVYIDDVVEALISAATAPGIDQQIINVGSGQETTVDELIEQMAQTIGVKANVLHNTETSGGIARLVADLHKAQRLLQYEPSVDLALGLQKLLLLDPHLQGLGSSEPKRKAVAALAAA